MRYLILLIIVFTSCKQVSDKKVEPKTFEEIHNQAIFVDTHNDFLTKTMEKGYVFDKDLKGLTHSDLTLNL